MTGAIRIEPVVVHINMEAPFDFSDVSIAGIEIPTAHISIEIGPHVTDGESSENLILKIPLRRVKIKVTDERKKS